MGRLGFNLVRQKDASKNVENGLPDQQNEKNENVEISDLILVIEERNRMIKMLRLLLLILSIVLICSGIYLIQLVRQNTGSNFRQTAALQGQFDTNSQEMETLQKQFDVMLSEAQTEQTKNCTEEQSALRVDLAKLELELTKQRQMCIESLTERDSLSAQCAQTEDKLNTELDKLREERDDLLRKLETASRKAAERQLQRSLVTPRPSPKTTTTTEAYLLFDSERLKKINDLVKDIETGAALINFKEFMKKSDDVFQL